jgi:hypothetical protein
MGGGVQAGPVEVTSQLKGVMVALYRHRGEWLLNTLMGPDGMHPFSVKRGSSLAGTFFPPSWRACIATAHLPLTSPSPLPE